MSGYITVLTSSNLRTSDSDKCGMFLEVRTENETICLCLSTWDPPVAKTERRIVILNVINFINQCSSVLKSHSDDDDENDDDNDSDDNDDPIQAVALIPEVDICQSIYSLLLQL